MGKPASGNDYVVDAAPTLRWKCGLILVVATVLVTELAWLLAISYAIYSLTKEAL